MNNKILSSDHKRMLQDNLSIQELKQYHISLKEDS